VGVEREAAHHDSRAEQARRPREQQHLEDAVRRGVERMRPARAQLDAIRRLAPRLPEACRQALSDQADAILEIASALVALDRRDLEAAWHRAHTAV